MPPTTASHNKRRGRGAGSRRSGVVRPRVGLAGLSWVCWYSIAALSARSRDVVSRVGLGVPAANAS